MKVKEILELPVGTQLEDFKAIVKKKSMGTKKNGEKFLSITFSDATGDIEFPVWEKVEDRDKAISQGMILKVLGSTTKYNDAVQIQLSGFLPVDRTLEDIHDYLPSYEIPTDMMSLFMDTYTKLSEPYKTYLEFCTGCNDLSSQKWDDYITCVAASSGHQNKLGGLFIHSVGVLSNIENMISSYGNNPLFLNCTNVFNPDRLRALALTHDLGKTYEYEFRTGIHYKLNAKWDHRMWYCTFMDKEYSRFLQDGPFNYEDNEIIKRVRLSEDDIDRMKYSVLSHHGPWGAFKPKTLEDTMLHLADMIDSKIIGCSENGSETERINFSLSGMQSASEKG